jgi:hypothetical protein
MKLFHFLGIFDMEVQLINFRRLLNDCALQCDESNEMRELLHNTIHIYMFTFRLLRTRDQHTNSNNCGITTERGSSGEVILTLARPATVISNASTASSPAPSENKLTKEER